MSKHANVVETAGKSRPMDDSEAEGIVGGTGDPPATPPVDDSPPPDFHTGAHGGNPPNPGEAQD